MHRRYNMKVVAFVLVLAFSQRLGLNLWMHHWYHEASASRVADKPGLPHWEIRCDCFDDAFMPMEQADTFKLQAPRSGFQLLEWPNLPGVIYSVPLLSSLRGPPSTQC